MRAALLFDLFELVRGRLLAGWLLQAHPAWACAALVGLAVLLVRVYVKGSRAAER